MIDHLDQLSVRIQSRILGGGGGGDIYVVTVPYCTVMSTNIKKIDTVTVLQCFTEVKFEPVFQFRFEKYGRLKGA
jgi:hypothetical protein